MKIREKLVFAGIVLAVLLCTSCSEMFSSLKGGVARDIYGMPTKGKPTQTTVTGNQFWDDSRLIVSNKKPLFFAAGYRTRGVWVEGTDAYGEQYWEAGMSPDNVWKCLPDSVKPYTVYTFHFNDEGAKGTTENLAKQWFDLCLTWCDQNKVPGTIVICAAGTSGGTHTFNAIDPATGEDKAWLDSMISKHPSLKGFVSTEHWWNGGTGAGLADRSADWINYCAEKNKTFIIHDSGPDSVTYTGRGSTKFKEAMKKYGKDHLIHSFKSTTGSFLMHGDSYLVAHWLAEYSHAYGGLIDTWRWNNTGIGPAMSGTFTNRFGAKAPGGDGNGAGYSQLGSYPGGYLASNLMYMYLNGGTVFNFEAPFHVQGDSGHASELLTEVIGPFFEWMVEHPAPTAEEMRSSQKYYMLGDNNTMNSLYDTLDIVAKGNFTGYAGGKENYQGNGVRVLTTGRYDIMPYFWKDDFASESEAQAHMRSLSGGSNAEVKKSVNKSEWDTYFRRLTENPSIETGRTEAFAAKRVLDSKDTWFFYNWKMESGPDYDTTGRQVAKVQLDNNHHLEVSLTPYTALIVEKTDASTFTVYLNNYCIDSAEAVWGKIKNEGTRGQVYIDNIFKGGINTNSHKTKFIRSTNLYLSGYSNVSYTIDKAQDFPLASIGKSTVGGATKLAVNSNGWVRFTINVR